MQIVALVLDMEIAIMKFCYYHNTVPKARYITHF